MKAVIGFGANLGDRIATIARALVTIAELADVEVLKCSSFYETEPIGGPAQPAFTNGALLVEIGGRWTPPALVRALLDIERALGRVRGERNGPRTIDLDLLWIEGVEHHGEDALVPHPRLSTRAFALAPLLEVAPDARDADGARYADALALVGMQGVRRLARSPRV